MNKEINFKFIYIILLIIICGIIYGDYLIYLWSIKNNRMSDFICGNCLAISLILGFLLIATDILDNIIENTYKFLTKKRTIRF